MNEIYPIATIVIIGLMLYYLFTYKTKKEKAYEKHLTDSLNDEFILDPETGAKLTLEQAESGHWIEHDNEFLTKNEKLYSIEEKNAETALNYLRKSKEYLKHQFSEVELEFLESTKILEKYNDWSYSNAFKIEYCDGFIFHPAVVIEGSQYSYYDDDYHESQIMFWIKLNDDLGHYYLREKLISKKLLDLIKNDDDLKLNNYESFTFRKSDNIITTIQLLDKLKNQKELEVEFYNTNLLLKNLKYVNIEDLLRIESLVKTLF